MIANTEILRIAIEKKDVESAVKRLAAAGVGEEWIAATLVELGYMEPVN